MRANPETYDLRPRLWLLTGFAIFDARMYFSLKRQRRLHNRKKLTFNFKAITSSCQASPIAVDCVASTGYNLKWGHLDMLARRRSDTHCKIKETLLTRDLKPTLNDNVCSEKLYLYGLHVFNVQFFLASVTLLIVSSNIY